MLVVDLIAKKRDGKSLRKEEIDFLINGYTNGQIPDYQLSALLMAIYLRGMNKRETADLTNAMLESGEILDLSGINAPSIGKHSTGGVGDKTSLILAPIAAAAGLAVPQTTGRGLGQTGGTLDKLDSIPGYNSGLTPKQFLSIVKQCGAVLVGQTKKIAPADKKIYALRDVTATVSSIPLITASIMSKKLAEGTDGLVLDVKTGSGAFMKTMTDSLDLAGSLMRTAESFGKKVMAFITDMNQPLGVNIGNWLEVKECIEVLQGADVPDLLDVTHHLAGGMIFLAGKAGSLEEGIDLSKKKLASGEAFDRFLTMVELQRGDIRFLKNPGKYPKPKYSAEVTADKDGYLRSVNTYEIGMTSAMLGAGRMTKEDTIDPKAGIMFSAKIGDTIRKGDRIAVLYTDKKEMLEQASGKIKAALTFSEKPVRQPKLIKKILQ